MYDGDLYDNWMYDVVQLWNGYLEYINEGAKGYKKAQLYLYGGTNVGKTSIIERLIG